MGGLFPETVHGRGVEGRPVDPLGVPLLPRLASCASYHRWGRRGGSNGAAQRRDGAGRRRGDDGDSRIGRRGLQDAPVQRPTHEGNGGPAPGPSRPAGGGATRPSAVGAPERRGHAVSEHTASDARRVGGVRASTDEVPSHRMSDTWFGASTIEGTFCYATRTAGRLRLDRLPLRMHRAVRPLRVRNEAKEPPAPERVQLPAPHLALYATPDDSLWPDAVTMTHRTPEEGAAVQIREGPPIDVRTATRLQEPREQNKGGLMTSTFSAVGPCLGAAVALGLCVRGLSVVCWVLGVGGFPVFSDSSWWLCRVVCRFVPSRALGRIFCRIPTCGRRL